MRRPILVLAFVGVTCPVMAQETPSAFLARLERLARPPAGPAVIVVHGPTSPAPALSSDILAGLEARQYRPSPGPWPLEPAVYVAPSSRANVLELLPATPLSEPFLAPYWMADPRFFWTAAAGGTFLAPSTGVQRRRR